MAAQSKTNPVNDNIEAAAERVAELNEKTAERVTEFNEKALENGKKAGVAYLDSYEKAVVAARRRLREGRLRHPKIDWLSSVAVSQADFAREVTKAYTTAARELVR